MPRRSTKHIPFEGTPRRGCSVNCTYLNLYEGAQRSLADMADRQGESLGQHRKIRAGLVRIAKKNFPKEFRNAELALGERFENAPDLVLITYLEKWVSHVAPGIASLPELPKAADPGIAALRSELRKAGFPVGDDDDMTAWSQAVAKTNLARVSELPVHRIPASTQERPIPNEAPGVVSHQGQLDDIFEEEPMWGGESAVPWVKDADARGAAELDDLLATLPEGPPGAAVKTGGDKGKSNGVKDEPNDTSPDSLDDLFTDDGDGQGVQTELKDDPSRDPIDNFLNEVADATDDDDVTEEEPSKWWDEDVIESQKDPLDKLFSDAEKEEQQLETPELDDLFLDVDEDPTPGAGDGLAETSPAPDTDPVLVSLFEDPVTDPPAPESDVPERPVLQRTLKPEIQANTKRKRGRKRQKRPATRPAGSPATIADDDEITTKMLAAITSPRPMFSSDLESIAGGADAVDAWIADMRGRGTKSPVRVIAPKRHYKTLGALIIPHGQLREVAKDFDVSAWAECIDQYSGGSLYEMAVLLSRIGPGLLGGRFSPGSAVLRVSQKGGSLAGLVVVLTNDLEPSSKDHDVILDATEELIRERLNRVVLLAARAGQRDLISEAVLSGAQDRGWQPIMPVVLGMVREWEADGAVTDLLLGG